MQRVASEGDVCWIRLDFWATFLAAERRAEISDTVLDCIHRLEQGENILVHCAAGIHRTGTFAYLILRRLGNTTKGARAFLGELRQVTLENVGIERLRQVDDYFHEFLAQQTRRR